MPLDLRQNMHERIYHCAARAYAVILPDWPAERIREAMRGAALPEAIVLYDIYELDGGTCVEEWITELAEDILETCFPDGIPATHG